MQHLTADQLEELRASLDAERADLEEQLAEHGKRSAGDWQGTPAGFEPGEPDESDNADRMEELTNNVPLVEELESRLKDVNDALKKMDAAQYGMCEKTGKEIPFERLKANPAARTVVEDAQ